MNLKLRYSWIEEFSKYHGRVSVSRLLYQKSKTSFQLPNPVTHGPYYLLELRNVLLIIKRIGPSRDIRAEIVLDDLVIKEPLGRMYDKYVFGKFGYTEGSDLGFKLEFPDPSFRISTPSFFINGRDNYSHFLYDFLPRAFIRNEFGDLGDIPICYIAGNDYQDSVFKCFGISDYHRLNRDSNEVSIIFDHLFVPTGFPPYFAYRNYQERLPPIYDKFRKLVIWKDSGNQRIINHDELRSTLLDLGYTFFHPERSDFETVLKTMGTTESLVFFADGSSANAYFAPASSKKLFVINQDFYFSDDLTLRAPLEAISPLENLQLLCGAASRTSTAPHFDPYYVDLPSLVAALS